MLALHLPIPAKRSNQEPNPWPLLEVGPELLRAGDQRVRSDAAHIVRFDPALAPIRGAGTALIGDVHTRSPLQQRSRSRRVGTVEVPLGLRRLAMRLGHSFAGG